MSVYNNSILSIIRKINKPTMNGCEVGVWKGGTSKLLLESFPGLHHHMVDSWEIEGSQLRLKTQQEIDDGKREALHVTDFANNRRTVIHKESVEASKQFSDDFFDFVYIDANHIYEYVKEDVEAWWPKVKQGGVMLGHDYNGRLERKGKWGVKKAVVEYCNKHGLKVVVNPSLIFSVYK